MIVPDDKNWTWVIEAPCPECGFVAADLARESVAELVRANATTWQAALAAPDAARRTRDDRWSPLEYGCHVRDVLRVYDERLRRMLTEVGPHYENWDQDITAIEDRYGEQDPTTVAAEIAAIAPVIADRFAGAHGDDWQRTGYRSDGAAFTVETIARYFAHDLVHHLWDIGA